jgi:long-chain fatty acid transport protein
MKKNNKMILLLIALLVAAAPAATWAGGLYLYEVGPAEVRTASAGIAARAQDASTVFTNPAGMTRIKQPEILFGAQPLYAHLDFESDSNTSASNETQPGPGNKGADDGDASAWIATGSTYYVAPITSQLSLGIGVLGYFGSVLNYDNGWVGRYYAREVQLQGLTFMPAAAYRVNDWLSFGAGLNAMYAMLKEKMAVNNTPLLDPLGRRDFPDGELEIKDNEWGFGFLAGVLVEPTPHTRFGLTYLSKTRLDFEVNTDWSDLRPGLAAILGSHGLLDADISMEVNVPQAVMLSAYHEMNDRWAVMGNLGWQDWSDFGSIDVGLSAEESTSLTVDAHYKDTWHAAAGVQYKASEPLLLSLGVAFDSSMMGDGQRSPALPLGLAWRFGTGAQYKAKKNIDLSLAYEFIWTGDMEMDVNRGPLAGRVSGEYDDTSLQVISLALNWRF